MRLEPTWIVIHCNGVDGRTVDDVRAFHVNNRGWNDIGYHYVIEDDDHATIKRGRPEHEPGAHASGANGWAPGAQDDTLAICVIGDLDKHPPSLRQWVSITTKCRELMAAHNIPAHRVIGHREVPEHIKSAKPTRKTCPGKHFDMDKLREDLGAQPEVS